MAFRGRRRFPVRRQSSPRRKLQWARAHNLPAGTGLAVGPSFTVVDLLSDVESVTGARVQDATIMAIRGVLVLATGVTPSSITVGIKVMDRTLIAAGAAIANVGPLTGDRYGDWMFRRSGFAVNGTLSHPANGRDPDIMVRSKRKLANLNDTLALVAEAPATSTATSFYYELSILLALA